MPDNMTCPACDATFSSVLMAFRDNRPCPECGLSASAAREILDVMQSRADSELAGRFADAVKAVDGLRRENGVLRFRLHAIEVALKAEPPQW